MTIRSVRTVRFAPLVVLGLLLGACAGSRTDQITLKPDVVRGNRFPALDVRNFNGEVFIRMNDRLRTPEIVADVLVSNQVAKEERASALASVVVDSRVEQQSGGDVLIVESSTTWARPDLITVGLRVTLPECTGVRVENAGGRVDVMGVEGAIQVSNLAFGKKRAPVLVRTNRVLDQPVLLTTDRGSVVLQVTPLARGDLELTSGSSGPEVYARAASAAGVMMQGNTLHASIGGGGNPIMLRADDGLVRVMILEDAESYASLLH